jgi:heme oxygenase (biliverdin-IX-beta and delta-forming)
MAEYCRILVAYAQAHCRAEQYLIQAEKTITLDALPCYSPRLPSLCNDLRSLAMHVDLPQSETLVTSQLTKPQGMFHYIGLRYVLEGATQGSKFIAKRLKNNLPLLASQAFSFWDMQQKASRQWPYFCKFINQPAKCVACERQMIQAAKITFQIFIECFSFPRRKHEKCLFW